MKHIAVVRQPFYNMILNCEKTIESRWSLNKCAPYKRVAKNDIIYFKLPGKLISAVAEVEDAKFYELNSSLAEKIKTLYGKEIGIHKFENWETYKNKKYLTLIWLKNIRVIKPFKIEKKNKAGWVIIK